MIQGKYYKFKWSDINTTKTKLQTRYKTNIKALFCTFLVTKNGEITTPEGVRDLFLEKKTMFSHEELKIWKNDNKDEQSEVNTTNSNHIFPWMTEDMKNIW